MSIPKIYIDTSVIGGCFDTDFAAWSNGLMKDFSRGHFKPVVSELVGVEIEAAPEKVREKYAEILASGAEILVITGKVLDPAAAYRKYNILNPKFENDRLHIALATVHEVDILVSWNFKHIVHFDKIRMFNEINQKMGYKPIAIYSPREVTNYEEND